MTLRAVKDELLLLTCAVTAPLMAPRVTSPRSEVTKSVPLVPLTSTEPRLAVMASGVAAGTVMVMSVSCLQGREP